MKLKIYTIDFEIPPHVKKWALRIGIPAVVLTGAVVALAAPLHVWNQQDTLNAADLNANFASLQSSIPVVTSWNSYTPTVTVSGTDVTATMGTSGSWRRVGDTAEVAIVANPTSCPTSGPLHFSLPDTIIPDSTKILALEAFGWGIGYGPGTSNAVVPLIVTSQGANSYVALDLSGAPGGGASCSAVGAGGAFRISFHTPVQGWTVTGP
jgi:hypothetical protein